MNDDDNGQVLLEDGEELSTKDILQIDITKVRIASGLDNKLYVWLDTGETGPHRWRGVGVDPGTAIHVAAGISQMAMQMVMQESKIGGMSH